MPQYIVVSQTVSKSWRVPEGKTPQEFLSEVLDFGFESSNPPDREEVLSEEHYLMDDSGACEEISEDCGDEDE
jgi:hypothetical protein